MYNKQLETFIKVADAGSFSKAAELLYITPTAVIKQINSLEKNLGVVLFDRTHRGLTLTDGGESLYQDAKYMIRYSQNAVSKAKNIMSKSDNTVRIGYSPMNPIQWLMEKLPKIQEQCPDIKYEIVPFENTPENAQEILKNLGVNIDVIAGIFDQTLLDLRGCEGEELYQEPLYCAVSIHHPLSSKDKISINDLEYKDLMMIHRGWSCSMDALRNYLEGYKDIHIVDFEFYNTDIFNQCVNTNSIIVSVPCWDKVHPLLKVIPVDWGYSMPFGLLHASHPNIAVKRFLEAAKTS